MHLAVIEILPPQRRIQLDNLSQAANVFLAETTVGHLAEEPIKFTPLVLAVAHAVSVRPSF